MYNFAYLKSCCIFANVYKLKVKVKDYGKI